MMIYCLFVCLFVYEIFILPAIQLINTNIRKNQKGKIAEETQTSCYISLRFLGSLQKFKVMMKKKGGKRLFFSVSENWILIKRVN